MRAGELLQELGPSRMISVAADVAVTEAVRRMTENNVGAVLAATEDHRPLGLLTERDVVRAWSTFEGRPRSEIRVREALSGRWITVDAADQLNDVLPVMTRADVSHVPVLGEGGVCIGVLSLAEVADRQVRTLMDEILHLEDYLNDLREAAAD